MNQRVDPPVPRVALLLGVFRAARGWRAAYDAEGVELDLAEERLLAALDALERNELVVSLRAQGLRGKSRKQRVAIYRGEEGRIAALAGRKGP